MAESSSGSSQLESHEYKAVKALLPRLIEKIPPEEISDRLFSEGIITKEMHESSFDRTELRKDRTRELITCVLDAIALGKSVFDSFCSILEESTKPSICKLGQQMRGQ